MAQRTTSPPPPPDIESEQLTSLLRQNRDASAANIVDWDADDDPVNPQNWSNRKKWLNILSISSMSFSVPLASTIYAPGVLDAFAEFNSDSSLLQTLSVSIMVLGVAAGPLFSAPLSEIYGRKPVYIVSNFFFIAFTLGCGAANSVTTLIIMRFFQGVGGSTPTMLGGASIADMYPPELRGWPMSIWGSGTLLGPIIGPIAGGFITQDLGWRWTFWIQSMIGGLTMIMCIFGLHESYAYVVLERKAKRIRKEMGDPTFVSALYHGETKKEHFVQAIKRPLSILFFSPVTGLFSVYYAVLFGYLYLLIATFPSTFSGTYGFDASSIGLAYLGLGVGTPFGLFIAGRFSDTLYAYLTKKNSGIQKPEYRIPPMFISNPLVAIALFWYGWTAEYEVHWMAPITATAFFSAGLIPVFLSINMYLVDVFPTYAASALAASKIVQSVGGAFLPLAAEPLYDKLGLGWGNSILAFLALAMVPVPVLFWWYGEEMRGWGRYGAVKL